MSTAIVDITAPLPVVPHDTGYPTIVLSSPVFADGGCRRRRLIVRGRRAAAAACVAYLGMLAVCVTASPAGRPPAATGTARAVTGAGVPGAAAPRQPRAVARVAPRAEPPVRSFDDDADQDAPLLFRLAPPAATHVATPKPAGTTKPVPTARPHSVSAQAAHSSKRSAR